MEEDPDIDIEENNLMYPRIESIYSDVNIKAELIDIEDEYDSIEIAESSSDYYMPFPNKIILGSKPSTLVQSEPLPGPSTASDNWEDQDNFFECAECSLIFPTQNELDSHKMASHSFLIARPMSRAIKTERKISVSSTSSRSFIDDSSSKEETTRRQKAVKSTAKSGLNKTFPMLHNALKSVSNNPYLDINPPVAGNQTKDTTDVGDRLLCKHCDVRFPDEIALIKHTYELLPEAKFKCDICQLSFDSQVALGAHMAKHFKKTGECGPPNVSRMLLQCVYCTCFLTYPGYMKKHLMNNHKAAEYAVKHVKFTGTCAICSSTLSSYKQYNNHVMKCHRKIFMSRTPYRFGASPANMKCMLCSQIFTSRYSAYKHKAEKHPEHSQKQTFNTVYDKPIKQLPTNPQVVKPKLQTAKNLLENKNYIPKHNLFKCNKCQIHFVSCSAAFAHSKRCSLAKGDWKCNKCRRTFTKTEKSLHTQQHQFSEKIKVHIVCDKILSKVLCRCPKCELLFDELTFREHISVDCTSKNGMECKTCNLKIHSDSYAKHRRYHNKYNFLSGDFILIDFVDVSFENTPIKKEKEEQYKQTLLYCSNCKCHFYKIKSKQKYHLERKCETLIKRSCTICGLTFSRKPYLTHMSYDHEILKLKLDEIKFIRIQDFKAINPDMPDFFQCSKCEVQFISPVGINNHSCSKQVFVKCSKCSQKYDSVTHDIHLTFHNYGRSKIENKASSNLLKFYSCVACNYGFHSYDSVVEHCQYHYTNCEELVTKPCKMCKLNYADDHKISHTSRAKFEILKFHYEKLLTDDWLAGFDSLPKDVVEDILSRSVYGILRNVRLELLVEGPTERTLYKCAQCELNFDQDYVIEHTMESCSSSPRFECSSCSAAFKTRVAKNNHMNVHVIYGDDITFREIIFNYGIDKELNEALRTGRQKESLKFRKCQQCKLLIKKSDYQTHISTHNNKVEIKQFTFRRTNKLISYKLFKPGHAGRKLYTVYKCKSCNACIMQKANMIRHKCGPPDRYEKCSKCSLNFLAWNIKRHIAQHAIIPKFIPKNILVLEFQLINNSDNLVKKRRRYSSDDDASTGSRVTLSVTKKYDTRKIIGRPYNYNLSEESQDSFLDDASVETSVTSNAYAKKYIKKSCIGKVGNDNESEESQDKKELTPGKKKELYDLTLDIEKWRIDMKNKLYQCQRCYLCFPYKQLLLSHLSECDDSVSSESALICDRCNIVLHPSLILFHEKLHELVRQNPIENYFYLIHISTNGIHTNNEKQWLHKCNLCGVHYLNIRSLERHFSSNHKLLDCVNCEICGLQFTQHSRTRHMRIQHNEGDWSKDDLHIEITQKKIVDIGEVHLTLFSKADSRNKNRSIQIDKIVHDENQSIESTMEKEDSTKKISTAVSIEPYKEDSKVASPAIILEEKEVENNTDASKDEDQKIDNKLYKCDKCSQHYLTKFRLVSHIMTSSHKTKPLPCDICGLFFEKRTLVTHKSEQHEKLKLAREDFIITNLKPENQNDKTITDEAVESRVNVPNEMAESDTSIDASLSRNEEQNDSYSEKIKEIRNKIKSGVSGPIDNHIYKCVECSVYYTNRRTLLLHIVIKKHKQFEFLSCDICGLLFGRGSLQKHKNVQHEKLNLTRKDFIITDVFGSRLLDSENNDHSINKHSSSIDPDDLPLTELENKVELDNKEKLVDKFVKEKKVHIFRLYQCKDCRICIQKTERKLHVCCSDIQKKQCIKCCLSFRNTDVIQHRRLHRKYRELCRKNFVLVRFGRRTPKNNKIYKCVSCSTHFMSLIALEWHINAVNHQTMRDYCKNCGLFFGRYSLSRHIYVHHKKLNLTVRQLNIVYVSDTDKNLLNIGMEANKLNNSINTTMSETEGTPDVKIVKKLFKCVECDVYFLTRASYYHHIYKHKKLDPTEYIDCNICDLQFLNESLGMHMKSHKDKSFCLDKLLIEEYQPNSTDSPKIEFYFAKDTLNNKLVSTTTLFDNDDETVSNHTDEQLSIIDSTSDTLPKTRTGEMVNENPNSYPHNSVSSGEEGTLNPIVELIDLDVHANLSD